MKAGTLLSSDRSSDQGLPATSLSKLPKICAVAHLFAGVPTGRVMVELGGKNIDTERPSQNRAREHCVCSPDHGSAQRRDNHMTTSEVFLPSPDLRIPRQQHYLDRLRAQQSGLRYPSLAGTLSVRPGVAHPKRDTHLLTLVALPLARGRILDAFCGCGLIGLTLANEAKSCTFLDISDVAIGNARENAEELKVANICHFVVGTIAKLQGEAPFDLIVANPPYTDAEANDDVDRILFDPDHAAVADFIDVIDSILTPTGQLLMTWSDFASYRWLEEALSKRQLEYRVRGILTEPEERGDVAWTAPRIEYRVYDIRPRSTIKTGRGRPR
jgi:tRNA1(Val) A37 N6-methylase TrmN6